MIIDKLLIIMYYYYVIKKCTLKSEEEGKELAKRIALRERIDYIIKSSHAHCIAGERIDYIINCMIRNGRHIYNRVDIHAKEKKIIVAFDIRHLPDL